MLTVNDGVSHSSRLVGYWSWECWAQPLTHNAAFGECLLGREFWERRPGQPDVQGCHRLTRSCFCPTCSLWLHRNDSAHWQQSGLGRRGYECFVSKIILYLTLMPSEEHLLPPAFFLCFTSIVMRGKDRFFFLFWFTMGNNLVIVQCYFSHFIW